MRHPLSGHAFRHFSASVSGYWSIGRGGSLEPCRVCGYILLYGHFAWIFSAPQTKSFVSDALRVDSSFACYVLS